jgi:hypothetical protein
VRSRSMVAGALFAGLTACAAPSVGPTGYAKADADRGASYGYRDKEIGDGEFSIVATGNRVTGKERVAEIALLRAARIAEERGRTHFLILNQKSERLQNTQTQNVVIFFPAFAGFPAAVGAIPVGERTTMEPMTVLLIRLLPAEGEHPSDAVSAAQVIEHLASKLQSAP